MCRRFLGLSLGTLVGAWAVAASPIPVVEQQPAEASCRQQGSVVTLPDLPEASGLAVSRAPGRLWAHNDSGPPVLFALDAKGTVTGRVTVSGGRVEDWEAIAVGPCPAGSCIYVGDIGDNDGKRPRITIYRSPEPDGKARTTAVSEVVHATYPDGGHDAEALLIGGDGRLYIVTKGDTGPVALYRFPSELRPGATVRLERVGGLRAPGKPAGDDRITDGSVSPDGQWVVLRTRAALTLYRGNEFFAGKWPEGRRIDLRELGEPQGEAVAFGADHVIYVAGEGGGKAQPGTFARLACRVDSTGSRQIAR